MKEIIKEYVTGNKTHFEIAWDIRHSFDEIIKELLLFQLIDKIIDKLKQGLNDGWSIDDKKVERKGEPIIYLKKDLWNMRQKGKELPLFCFFLGGCYGARKLNELYFGIELLEEVSSEDSSKIKKLLVGNWNTNHSPYWQWPDDIEYREIWKKEFLVKLLSQDEIDKTASYYAKTLLNLKESVEPVIDDIVKSRKCSER